MLWCTEDSFKAPALVLTAYLREGLCEASPAVVPAMSSFGNRKASYLFWMRQPHTMKDPPAQVDRYRYTGHSGSRISGNKGKRKAEKRNSEL